MLRIPTVFTRYVAPYKNKSRAESKSKIKHKSKGRRKRKIKPKSKSKIKTVTESKNTVCLSFQDSYIIAPFLLTMQFL